MMAEQQLRQSTKDRLKAVLAEIDERLRLMEQLIAEVREEEGNEPCP